MDCHLQSISASIGAVCRKTLHKVNCDSRHNFCPEKFRKTICHTKSVVFYGHLPAVWPRSPLQKRRMAASSRFLRARAKMSQTENKGAEIRAQLHELLYRHEYPGNTKILCSWPTLILGWNTTPLSGCSATPNCTDPHSRWCG